METSGAEKQIVRVTIFNQTYSVSTSGDPRQTQELAEEIDELMSAIARRAGNRVTLLAALANPSGAVHAFEPLARVRERLEREIRSAKSKLSKEGFLTRGPATVGQSEREKHARLESELEALDVGGGVR